MDPSKELVGNVWPGSVSRVNTGGENPGCTVVEAMEALLGEIVKLVKRLPGTDSAKVKLVIPTVENSVTGTLLLCPTCRTVDPTPS